MSKLHSVQPGKPYKVWSADRQTRKSITASNLTELKFRSAEKLSYDQYNLSNLRVVLENDGTEVEDEQYFQSAERDTIFLLLRDDEQWLPPGFDALKTALTAIPQIVCDTINSLKLANKPPTWSIHDDRGFITVTLQWEHDQDHQLQQQQLQQEQLERQLLINDLLDDQLSTSQPFAQYGGKVYSSTFPRHGTTRAKSTESYLRAMRMGFGGSNVLPSTFRSSSIPSKTLSADDFSIIDRIDDLSSAHDLTSFCDFHCSTLHRDGGSIKVSKSVGTSPIPDFRSHTTSPIISTSVSNHSRTTSPFVETVLVPFAQPQPQAQIMTTTTTTTMASKPAKGKGHVRFMDMDKSGIIGPSSTSTSSRTKTELSSMINGQISYGSVPSSDESETETTEREDEQICERYLVLVDQPSATLKRPNLSILDIGRILERFRSKIIDVDKLERDKENVGCYNWLIRATIRGEMLREVGVVYNGQYYGLMEHPEFF